MNRRLAPASTQQSHAIDKFLYFFMGLRKSEIRRRVKQLKAEFPDESPEQLARELIAAHTPLSLVGGALLHVPMFLPGIGSALKLVGLAGGTAVILRMHLFLILEIATLFGRDIDEKARLKEMATVVALSGLASGSTMLAEAYSLKPYLALIAGGMAVTVVTQLIGEAAIRYYGRASAAGSTPDAQGAGAPA